MGIAVTSCSFTTFLTVTDWCWLCHRLNSLNDLAVASVKPPNNPSYYYCVSPTLPQLLWMLQRHLMFYTCNYNIRVTHRNGAIKHIFTRIRSTEGSSADCSLFPFLSLHALALHLAVKNITSNLSDEDLSTLALHTSVGCISLQNASRTALCYATNTIKWKHS